MSPLIRVVLVATVTSSTVACIEVPVPCTVFEDEDGAKVIECPQGSRETVFDGADGPDGADGQDGRDGQDAADGRDGAPGTDAVVDTDDLPLVWLTDLIDVEPGEICEGGGQAVVVGWDLNRNGILDEDEILDDKSVYICDELPPEVVEGSFVINNTYDLAQLEGAREVIGSVTIAQGLRTVSLPDLEVVYGDLRIGAEGAAILQEVHLPALREVGGQIFESSGGQMTELRLPALEKAGAIEGIRPSDSALRVVDLPLLQEVDGRVWITSYPELQELNLSVLERAGSMAMGSYPAMTELRLPALQRVDGFFVVGLNVLEELHLPELETCGYFYIEGPFTPVEGYTGLEVFDVRKLRHIHGTHDFGPESLVILRLQGLDELSLPALERVEGSAWFEANQDLERILLPRLEEVEGSLGIGNGADLEELDLSALERVEGELRLQFLGQGLALDLPALRYAEELNLLDLTELTAVHVPVLETLDSLRLSNVEGLSAFEAPSLEHVTDALRFQTSLSELQVVRLPELVSADVLEVRGTRALDEVFLPKLERVESLVVDDNAVLGTVLSPALAHATEVEISNNPAWFGFEPVVGITGGSAIIRHNPEWFQCEIDEIFSAFDTLSSVGNRSCAF